MSEPEKLTEPEPVPEQKAVEEAPKAKPSRKNLSRWIGAAALLAIIGYGISSAIFSSSHESTDNAAVTGEVVQVSAQVSATVRDIQFKDNQIVQAGQVLFVLDGAKLRTALDQARANLESAEAEAKAAGIDVSLTSKLSEANAVEAQGGIEQSTGGIGAAEATVDQFAAQLRSSQASTKVAESDVQDAQIGEQAAVLSLEKAKSDETSAKSAVNSAQSRVESARAGVNSAIAREAESAKEANRSKRLLEAGAISQQDSERAELAHTQAESDLEAAKQAQSVASSALEQSQSALVAAGKAVGLAQNAIRQAAIKTAGSRDRLAASRSGAVAAQALVDSARRNVAVASGKATQALGQQKSAQTAPQQIQLKQAAQELAMAKVDQARAAVKSAELDLQHARIVAPVSGRVSKRVAQIGLLAQVGSPLVSIVPLDSMYVLANFKETQTARIQVGQEVEINVDGIPGKKFHGKVDSLSAATGSTFALLPPDNATGNFVKVVQRLPVKIVFDDADRRDERLGVGMSVTAIVKTK